MLHPVNPPDCLDDMKKLLRYQRRFLLLLLRHPAPLNKTVFEAFFGKRLGGWSWARVYRANKPTEKLGKHVEALVQYAAAHRGECKATLLTIKHDHLFPDKRTDLSFAFRFPNLSVGWRDVLTPFFIAFYEILHNKNGYPAKHMGLKKGNLSWRSFMTAQYEKNPHVCPYCDGEQGDYTKRIDANDAEHWLPKSKYPHLSVHWANLFRTCMVCNERFKGDDDPIKHPGCGELRKTYHPYHQPARVSAQVAVSRTNSFPRLYQLSIDDGINPLCAGALEQVLCLSERWSGRINKRLRANKSALIADQVREVRRNRQTIDVDWVRDKLSMIAEFRQSDIGTEPNAMLENAVLNFQATQEVVSIHQALAQAHR